MITANVGNLLQETYVTISILADSKSEKLTRNVTLCITITNDLREARKRTFSPKAMISRRSGIREGEKFLTGKWPFVCLIRENGNPSAPPVGAVT